jgi:hypothetical protein
LGAEILAGRAIVVPIFGVAQETGTLLQLLYAKPVESTNWGFAEDTGSRVQQPHAINNAIDEFSRCEELVGVLATIHSLLNIILNTKRTSG